MGDPKEQIESGKSGTDKPWERPGQSSQDPSIKPPEKKDREREDRHNETS